jgi:hypothetical protein
MRCRDAAAGSLTDRRSAAHSPVDGRHVPGNRQASQHSQWTSAVSSEPGNGLAAPRVHQQPHDYRHKHGAPVSPTAGTRRTARERSWRGVSAGAQPGTSARSRARRRAAGIYGTIITAAILAAIGDHVHTLPLTVSILVTLVVYWLAEEYAELLGEQLEGGHLPTWADVRTALAATWPMVTASYIPLLALILAHLLGASPSAAANAGLVVAVVLLMIYAWSAGRAAQLRAGSYSSSRRSLPR